MHKEEAQPKVHKSCVFGGAGAGARLFGGKMQSLKHLAAQINGEVLEEMQEI